MKLENGKAYIGHSGNATAVLEQTEILGYWIATLITDRGVRKQPWEISQPDLMASLKWAGFDVDRAIWVALDHFPARKIRMEEPTSVGGYVYFARQESTGLIKIGHSYAPEDRIRAFGAGMHLMGLYPGGRMDESNIHERFAKYREEGEWFRIGVAIKRFIKNECCYIGEEQLFFSNGKFLQLFQSNDVNAISDI